jgi:hypothetical protein
LADHVVARPGQEAYDVLSEEDVVICNDDPSGDGNELEPSASHSR